MKDKFEQRSYTFEIKAEQNEEGIGIIRGRPIVYNQRTDLGYFYEVIESSALDGANLRDVRFLVNHDLSKIPLARSRRNTPNSTMQLSVDAEGLAIRVMLDTENNAEAKALYSAVQRGDISGMSFMFGINDEEWSDIESDHPTRHIREISTVVEVSAVTFPAYKDTTIDARSDDAMEIAKKALENARSALHKDSVDTELNLLQLKTESLFLGR